MEGIPKHEKEFPKNLVRRGWKKIEEHCCKMWFHSTGLQVFLLLVRIKVCSLQVRNVRNELPKVV